MKIVLFSALIAFGAFGHVDAERSVFVCGENDSKVYHLTKECSALSDCNSLINEITISQAEEQSLVLCDEED